MGRKNIKGGSLGQGMVEFALVFPLLLLLLFGIFEFGRIMFAYSATMAASREAARYGAAILDIGGGIPQYEDCAGIRSAAKRIGQFAGIDDSNITIQYSNSSGIYSTSCPPSQEVQAADTISVSISTSVTPVTPIGNFSAIPINSSSSRSILKNVRLGASGTGAGYVSGKLSDVNFKTTTQTAVETQGTISVVVELNEITASTVTVPFSVTGTAIRGAGADYQMTASPLVINPGEKTAMIYISLNHDGLDEGDESLIIGIDAPINATRGPQYIHTVRIVDPPDVSFANLTSTHAEGSGVTGLMVELSKGSPQDVTVSFTRSGSATWGAGGDYVTSPVSLTIPSGSLSGMLSLNVFDDVYDEYDETATITMASATNAVIKGNYYHTLTILDDDAPPQLSFYVANQVVSEEIGVFTTTVGLTEISGKPITVQYSTSGTTIPADYVIHTSSPLVIPPGSTSVDIHMDILEGDGFEPDETLILTLGSPVNASLGSIATQTITITEASTMPTVNFVGTSTTVVEGDLLINLVVRLSNAWSAPVVIPFSGAGTAQRGLDKDYMMTSSPLEIPVGWTQGTIQVLINDDEIDESTEDITVSFGAIENGLPGTLTSYQITILDNDTPPEVSFTSVSRTVLETHGAVVVTVEMDKLAEQDVTVPLILSGSATLNTDYQISTENLFIPSGTITRTFQITILDDMFYDPNETVGVRLGEPVNAILGSPINYILLIEDDELSTCEVGSHLLTVGSDMFSLSIVNEGEDIQFTGGTVNWVNAGGNKPRLISANFGGIGVFSGDVMPTSYNYSALVDFASLDTQVVSYYFNGSLGAGTHSMVSNFQSTIDGSTCSLTETFTIH